jgi:hypothetical protein
MMTLRKPELSSRRNARLAGTTFIFYIATTIVDGFVYAAATGTGDVATKLGTISQHTAEMRLTILFAILKIFYALILAVTLYALTRHVDREMALLAFTCRVVEGVINAMPATARFGLLSLAIATVAATPGDAASHATQATLLMGIAGWSGAVAGIVFAIGSTLFAYLFLRGQSIPAPIAWLGIIGSLLVAPLSALGGLGLVTRAMAWITSIPILLFELSLAFWLLTKGASEKVPSEERE